MKSKKKNLLLIEDDKVDQLAFKRFTEQREFPYDFNISSSVKAAKKLIKSKKYDIIVSDYSLGDGTAFEILEDLKETPLVIITGTGDEEIAVKAMKLGAYDYLIKDVEGNYLKMLPVTVENAIKRFQVEQELRQYHENLEKLVEERTAELEEEITERKQAEEEVKVKEHYFRLFSLSTGDCFWNWDMVANNVERSIGFERSFGYRKQEILSGIEWWGDRIHPEDKKIVWKTFGAAVAGEQSTCEYEYRFRCRDGSYAVVVDHVCLIRDASGKVVRSLGAMHDITERKQTREELRKSEKKFRNYVETSQDLIWECDNKGKFIYLNPAWEQVTGYKLSEMLGKPFADFTIKEEVEKNATEFAKHLEGGSVKGFPSTYISKNGSEIYLIFNAIPLYDSDNNIIGTQGAAYNITERKQAEEALKESKHRYQRLFEDSPISLWEEDFSEIKAYIDTLKTKGISNFREYFENNPDELTVCAQKVKVLDVNKATLALHQAKSKDELLGNLDKIFTEKSFEVFKEELIMLAEGGTRFESEAEIKTLSGECRDIYLRFSVMQAGENGSNYTRALLAISDITERKQAEEALRLREQQLSLIYDSTGDVLFYLKVEPGPHYRFLSVNRAFLKATGLTLEQIVGKSLNEVIPEQTLKLVRSNYEKAIREKKIVTWEETSQYPTGLKTGIVNIAPVLDHKGNCTHLVGAVHDITERKQAEEDFEKLLHDKGERVKEIRCLYGVSESIRTRNTQEETFQDVAELIPPGWHYPEITRGKVIFDGKEYVLEPFSETEWKQSSDIIVNGELRGLVQVYYLEECPELDEGPFMKEEWDLIAGMAQNIGEAIERKQAEEKLHKLNQQFQSSIDSMPTAYIIWNLDKKVVEWNRAAHKIFGFSREEMLGKNAAEFIVPKEARHLVAEALEKLKIGEIAEYSEKNNNIRKDGQSISCQWFNTPLADHTGHIFGFLTLAQDVTERMQAEEELKTLSAAIEQSPVVVTITDPKGNIEYVNPKFCELTGYSKEEVHGKNPSILQGGEVPKEVYKELWKTILAGKKWRGEFHNKKKNGELYWEEANISAIYDDSGNVTHFLAVKEDITERKLAEMALHQYAHIVSSSTDMMALLNNEYIYLAANAAYLQAFNVTADQLIGQTVSEVFGEEFFNSGIKPHAERCFAGEEVNFQLWVNYPTSGKRFMDITYYPYTDVEKKITGFVVNGRNITARKRAEDAIRESEVRYRSLVEQMPDGVYRSTPEGRFLEVNSAMVEMLGYESKKALLDVNIKKDLYFDVAERDVVNESLSKSGNEGIEIFRMRHKKGFEVWIEEHGRMVYDAGGNVLYHEGVLRDITDRKLAEAEKAKLEVQLRRSQKLETLGTLAGGIAHDFNNILTPIMGYADMALSDLQSSNPLYDDLVHILTGANRAKDLVEQILLFSRQIEKERKPFSLHLIVKEALKLLRPTIPTTIEIRQRIDASCDKVMADASQMHEVIVNLCTNAWQAMEEKGGTLTIELKQVAVDAATAKLHPKLKEQEYVRLTVSDTGTGMDDKTLDRIFEPFFTTKAVDKGTGMGLSVVHGIVASHHGDILIYSEQGKGSSFHVYLPTVKAEEGVASKEPEAIVGGQESILVVDDEEVVVQVVQRMLQRLGYKVDVCNNSLEALKTFRQQPDKYDLMISDLTMPNLTGLVLSEQLKKIRPKFPFIIMTGYGESLPKDILKHYGIQEIIGKPIILRELAGGIRKVLDSV